MANPRKPEKAPALRALTRVYLSVGYGLGTVALLAGIGEWFGEQGRSLVVTGILMGLGAALLVGLANLIVAFLDAAESGRRSADAGRSAAG